MHGTCETSLDNPDPFLCAVLRRLIHLELMRFRLLPWLGRKALIAFHGIKLLALPDRNCLQSWWNPSVPTQNWEVPHRSDASPLLR